MIALAIVFSRGCIDGRLHPCTAMAAPSTGECQASHLLLVRGLADGQARRRRVSAVEIGRYIKGASRIHQSLV